MNTLKPEQKPKAILNDWSCVDRLFGEYTRPFDNNALRGATEGHPAFADRSVVWTSFIVDVSYTDRWAETANTVYTLGTPEEMYVDWLRTNHPDDLEVIGVNSTDGQANQAAAAGE